MSRRTSASDVEHKVRPARTFVTILGLIVLCSVGASWLVYHRLPSRSFRSNAPQQPTPPGNDLPETQAEELEHRKTQASLVENIKPSRRVKPLAERAISVHDYVAAARHRAEATARDSTNRYSNCFERAWAMPESDPYLRCCLVHPDQRAVACAKGSETPNTEPLLEFAAAGLPSSHSDRTWSPAIVLPRSSVVNTQLSGSESQTVLDVAHIAILQGGATSVDAHAHAGRGRGRANRNCSHWRHCRE